MKRLGHHQPLVDRKRQLLKAGLAVAGVVILAVAMVGVWVSLWPSATALRPAGGPDTDTQRALTFTSYVSPRSIENIEFEDGDSRKRSLADFRGKVVLLNIWATWCGPCRKEMPTLDRLQLRLGSPDFEVVALSIDRDGQAAVRRFFDEINVRALAIYVDAAAQAGTKLGIIGVPTTLLIDREGGEVARYTGPTEWDRPEVIDVIKQYLPQHSP